MFNAAVREAQLKILKIFSETPTSFALSGGTALELFYLKHRFSRDLDFFSPKYNLNEIDNLVLKFSKVIDKKIKLENEFHTPEKAKIRFYTVKIKGSSFPLKIDFVEDVLFAKPNIQKFNKVPVYSVDNIYFQKIITLVGTHLILNETGREITTGRKEVRDIVDIYYLSKKVSPLHIFLKHLSKEYQRGMVQWYRSYSRQELKINVLDLHVYDKKFDVSKMIIYLDNEIKKFISEVIE